MSRELAAVLGGVEDLTPAAAPAVDAALRSLDGIRLLIMSRRRAALAASRHGQEGRDGRGRGGGHSTTSAIAHAVSQQRWDQRCVATSACCRRVHARHALSTCPRRRQRHADADAHTHPHTQIHTHAHIRQPPSSHAHTFSSSLTHIDLCRGLAADPTYPRCSE